MAPWRRSHHIPLISVIFHHTPSRSLANQYFSYQIIRTQTPRHLLLRSRVFSLNLLQIILQSIHHSVLSARKRRSLAHCRRSSPISVIPSWQIIPSWEVWNVKHCSLPLSIRRRQRSCRRTPRVPMSEILSFCSSFRLDLRSRKRILEVLSSSCSPRRISWTCAWAQYPSP